MGTFTNSSCDSEGPAYQEQRVLRNETSSRDTNFLNLCVDIVHVDASSPMIQ